MKLRFDRMDIGSYAFNFVRALSVAGSGAAELAECLKAAAAIRDNDDESWVRAWAGAGARASADAARAFAAGQTATARDAYLRASNYYRTAIFYMPPQEPRLGAYLTESRSAFQAAARLFPRPIEVIELPFESARLPGYYLSAGQPAGPTLIALNGGDSTNEELVQWIGFAAVARGWNFLVFEGPGQWSALQLHPQLLFRPDYEGPVAAAIDLLLARDEVDPRNIALIGYSLGAQLAARVAAFEPRISACICDGLVVDVNEAWKAVWPAVLRRAPPALLDALFALLERRNPEMRGFANHYRRVMGVAKAREIFEGWKPFNISQLAGEVACPMLLLYGEGEYEESGTAVIESVLRYLGGLKAPAAIHEFAYADGWAASHCQVGALKAAEAVIFDWLDRTRSHDPAVLTSGRLYDWAMMDKYYRSPAIEALKQNSRVFDA